MSSNMRDTSLPRENGDMWSIYVKMSDILFLIMPFVEFEITNIQQKVIR